MAKKFKTEEEWSQYVGELDDRIEKKGETLTGQDAAILLACMFANETHGNYEGDLLYERACVEDAYEVTLKKKGA